MAGGEEWEVGRVKYPTSLPGVSGAGPTGKRGLVLYNFGPRSSVRSSEMPDNLP